MKCIYSSRFDCDIVECEAHSITKETNWEIKLLAKYEEWGWWDEEPKDIAKMAGYISSILNPLHKQLQDKDKEIKLLKISLDSEKMSRGIDQTNN